MLVSLYFFLPFVARSNEGEFYLKLSFSKGENMYTPRINRSIQWRNWSRDASFTRSIFQPFALSRLNVDSFSLNLIFQIDLPPTVKFKFYSFAVPVTARNILIECTSADARKKAIPVQSNRVFSWKQIPGVRSRPRYARKYRRICAQLSRKVFLRSFLVSYVHTSFVLL